MKGKTDTDVLLRIDRGADAMKVKVDESTVYFSREVGGFARLDGETRAVMIDDIEMDALKTLGREYFGIVVERYGDPIARMRVKRDLLERHFVTNAFPTWGAAFALVPAQLFELVPEVEDLRREMGDSSCVLADLNGHEVG